EDFRFAPESRHLRVNEYTPLDRSIARKVGFAKDQQPLRTGESSPSKCAILVHQRTSLLTDCTAAVAWPKQVSARRREVPRAALADGQLHRLRYLDGEKLGGVAPDIVALAYDVGVQPGDQCFDFAAGMSTGKCPTINVACGSGGCSPSNYGYD